MGYMVVNVLGCVLIITALMVMLAKTPKLSAYFYAAQSCVICLIFIALGTITGSGELFTWAGTAFLTKAIIAPGVILFAIKKMGEQGENLAPKAQPAALIIAAVVEVAICFFVVSGVQLPIAADAKPVLAISLAHFFLGLTCIVTQRNILKQIFGYCLMENGSHVTLALLAPQAPELVEVGIATDAFFAVIIMAIMVWRIHTYAHTLDADDLMELKG